MSEQKGHFSEPLDIEKERQELIQLIRKEPSSFNNSEKKKRDAMKAGDAIFVELRGNQAQAPKLSLLANALAPEDQLAISKRLQRKCSFDIDVREKKKSQDLKNLLKSKLNSWLA